MEDKPKWVGKVSFDISKSDEEFEKAFGEKIGNIDEEISIKPATPSTLVAGRNCMAFAATRDAPVDSGAPLVTSEAVQSTGVSELSLVAEPLELSETPSSSSLSSFSSTLSSSSPSSASTPFGIDCSASLTGNLPPVSTSAVVEFQQKPQSIVSQADAVASVSAPPAKAQAPPTGIIPSLSKAYIGSTFGIPVTSASSSSSSVPSPVQTTPAASSKLSPWSLSDGPPVFSRVSKRHAPSAGDGYGPPFKKRSKPVDAAWIFDQLPRFRPSSGSTKSGGRVSDADIGVNLKAELEKEKDQHMELQKKIVSSLDPK